MSSSDPFSARFDSIEIDPARAPSQAALDHAFSLVAPAAAAPDFATPGFYLIDDAGGRFSVDRDFGVITLRDEAILARELGAVHAVRLKVVEQSGASYEMDMQLRITGRVPQMVGAEDLAALAGVAPAPAVAAPPTPQPPATTWSRYAVAADARAAPLGSETAAFGALLSIELPPRSGVTAMLTLNEPPPAPAARDADWSI